MADHKTTTDNQARITLPSSLEQVAWTVSSAAPGAVIGLSVQTCFVGNNAELRIVVTDRSGKKFGSYTDHIYGNRFWAGVQVPEEAKEELYAAVSLPKHGLSMKSDPLIVTSPVQITNLKWSQKEARRGDTLALTADVKGAPDGTEATIEIWEYDADGVHDPVTTFASVIKNSKVEAEWEYEYHDDVDDIPTQDELQPVGKTYNPPEYFFRLRVNEMSADSAVLEFRDWVEIELIDEEGVPIPNERYSLLLPDGTTREGTLNDDGYAREEDIPPGDYEISFPSAG